MPLNLDMLKKFRKDNNCEYITLMDTVKIIRIWEDCAYVAVRHHMYSPFVTFVTPNDKYPFIVESEFLNLPVDITRKFIRMCPYRRDLNEIKSFLDDLRNEGFVIGTSIYGNLTFKKGGE